MSVPDSLKITLQPEPYFGGDVACEEACAQRVDDRQVFNKLTP